VRFRAPLPAEKVKAIIIDKWVLRRQEATETSFTNDLGADSLDTVRLIMEFENSALFPMMTRPKTRIGTVGRAPYLEEHAK
jgi:acyl carrier protein